MTDGAVSLRDLDLDLIPQESGSIFRPTHWLALPSAGPAHLERLEALKAAEDVGSGHCAKKR